MYGLRLCPAKEKCGVTQGNILNPWLVNVLNDYEPCLFPFSNSHHETARARYSGPSRKLVVGLDIGTTFSGAAYALLDPGEVPRIQSVTRQAFLRSMIW